MRLHRLTILATILSFLFLFFTACKKSTPVQSDVKQRQDVIITLGNDEPEGGFDPCIGWGRYGSPLIQSTLIETDKDMNIVNDLATSYKLSDDRLTLTFTLRNDAKFTDGELVTADDIIFTFKTAKTSGSIVDLTDMADIYKSDNYTVHFRLHKPSLAFLYTIASTGIVPKHIYSSSYGDNPLGSGPYKLAKWDKGQQIILVANEDYYGKIPAIKKVIFLFMGEDASLAMAKAGKLDVAYTPATLATNKIDNMNLTRVRSIDNRGLTLPTIKNDGKKNSYGNKLGNNVTSDIAIRKALSYGIDRDRIVKDVINNFGTPAYTECDNMPWWNSDTVIKYDIEKAKDILTSAGWKIATDGMRYKNNIKAEFTILYSAGESTRQAIATSVKEQAKDLGISITLLGLSWDEIYPRMYSDVVLMGWGAQNPTESYLLYHSDNSGRDAHNPENYKNATVDKYMDKAMSSATTDESNRYWKKAQWNGKTGTSTLGDAPFVWLVNIDHLYYVKNGLDIGEQKIHPHGHAWPLVANLRDWKWR